MTIQKFEDIIAWQKAQDLATEIYQSFGILNDFAFRDQITRAAISISNNIAEGFDRKSDKEFARFLHIALGSTSELRSMLYLGERLRYIQNGHSKKLIEKSIEISKLIRGFIKALEPN